ncbi:TPA: hypothetical protein UN269_000064 [Stenotrophomonas maltophilia]|nr:hypothetical protein [Stenotrophomonas maltophilia]
MNSQVPPTPALPVPPPVLPLPSPGIGHGVISTVLHHVDVTGGVCVQSNIPVQTPDLNRYLQDLLAEIQQKPQSRSFTLSAGSQVSRALAAYSSSNTLTLAGSSIAADESRLLAERLLRIEIIAEGKYGHLSTRHSGHLNKGSFLQFLFRDNVGLHYLGVKVEHQLFLDEQDFKRRIGIGESNKIYKACKVTFDSSGQPAKILVFDTNSRISKYWWSDFWELSEARTDSQNTEDAIRGVVSVLGSLKKWLPADHTILRNAAVAAFRQKGPMQFDNFVDQVFKDYEVGAEHQKKFDEVVDRIRALPSSRGFDSHFTLVPSAVPFKRVNLALSNEILLSYDEGMANIAGKIWSSKTIQGKSVVVVEADEAAANKFAFKPME